MARSGAGFFVGNSLSVFDAQDLHPISQHRSRQLLRLGLDRTFSDHFSAKKIFYFL
jgi:hypothetical protein